MNRRHPILWTSILGTCVVAAAGMGCRRESPSQVQATPERPAAEVSFEVIAEIVKDGIEVRGGDVSGFVTQNTGASSRFQVHNTVTSQLIPPATANDPYRGKITVTSRSVYSLRWSAEEDDKREEEPVDNGFNLNDDSDDSGSGFSSLDRDLVSDSTDDEKAAATKLESVQRRPDEDVRTYDLVYQDGRWELTSKLDLKTEKAVENAFNRALSLQP
jgi:hypothetical protein